MYKYNSFCMFLAFLSMNEYLSRIQAYRVFDVKGVETILALKDEKINIECKTDMAMSYCGFIHPSGKRYSFSGSTLDAGQCAIISKVTEKDTGLWRCHIGTQPVGLEIMKTIQVRVVTELAAVQKNVTAVHGKPVTLACATTKGLVPLSYCRFEPPHGRPFSINSDVTASDPILGRYYFPSNRSLDRGDCAVTIRKVKYEDVGTWTCGAGLDDGKEHIDVIKFEVEGLYTMSTASATGIAIGVIGITGILGVLGFMAWKKRRFLGAVTPERVEREGHELAQISSPSPHRTPQSGRNVPRVIVDSPASDPSDPSLSPLISQVGV